MKQFKDIKEAEEILKNKIGHSTFTNMSRTIVKKKSFKSTTNIISSIFSDIKNDFFKRLRTEEQDFKDEYLKEKDREWKISVSENELEATSLYGMALITWKYKINNKNQKSKISIWFTVTSLFPLSFTSLNSSRQRIKIMKMFIDLKQNIKTNKKIKENEWKNQKS